MLLSRVHIRAYLPKRTGIPVHSAGGDLAADVELAQELCRTVRRGRILLGGPPGTVSGWQAC